MDFLLSEQDTNQPSHHILGISSDDLTLPLSVTVGDDTTSPPASKDHLTVPLNGPA